LPEKFEADLMSIKEYIKTTSEIPDGVEIKSKDPKFYYKLSEAINYKINFKENKI
jgi:hypothetical protein